MTPDEIAYLRAEFASPEDPERRPAAQARPNVLFEAGMAMGRAPDRTVLVELGTVRPFSDVAGRHAIRMTDEPESRKQLADRLKAADCAVDLSGEQWMRAGRFTVPSKPDKDSQFGEEVPSDLLNSEGSMPHPSSFHDDDSEIYADEVITPQEPPTGMNIENLLNNVKSHMLAPKQAAGISKLFSSMSQKSAYDLAAGMFAIYVEPGLFPEVQDNIKLLFPKLWICMCEDSREQFGIKYENYLINGNIKKSEEARFLIDLVDGGQYLTESIREAEISHSIDSLLSVHRDFNNFRKEPPAARELRDTLQSLKIIPESLYERYVVAIVEVFLARHYGVARGAAPIYREFIDNFTKRQARLALLSVFEPHIKEHLDSEKPQEQFSTIAKIIKPKLNRRYRKLLNTITSSPTPLHEVVDEPNIKHMIKSLRESM